MSPITSATTTVHRAPRAVAPPPSEPPAHLGAPDPVASPFEQKGKPLAPPCQNQKRKHLKIEANQYTYMEPYLHPCSQGGLQFANSREV